MSFDEPVAVDESAQLSRRRVEVAEAVIRIVARDGMRRLSHRAVDAEAGWSEGTTSYYARTERQLVQLAVRVLAARTSADLRDHVGEVRDVDDATRQLVEVIAAIAARESDARARLALSLELAGDPELHAAITHEAPVREQVVAGAAAVLAALALPADRRTASDLVAVLNGLLYDWLAGPGVEAAHRARAEPIVRAYLTGLSTPDPS